jgi:CRP/FNR family cyclic AMP-dependent transcriptional regulator
VPDEAFFAALDEDARKVLDSSGRRRQFGAGQVLFSEGDDGHDVIVLLSGAVKIVSTAASGREVILDVMESDELLGELSAIDGQPRSATAVALTPVEVLVIPAAPFNAFLESDGGAATELLRLVARRLRVSSQRQLEFGTSDAIGRICACVLRMLDSKPAPDNAEVTMLLAQHELAALTGLSREAVVKGLRALRQLGWIDLQGRTLHVLDEEALRQRAAT